MKQKNCIKKENNKQSVFSSLFVNFVVKYFFTDDNQTKNKESLSKSLS